jgi:hypothetical protein
MMRILKNTISDLKITFDKLLNFWRFRKEIYNFRNYDYVYNMQLFTKSLEFTAKQIGTHKHYKSHEQTQKDINRFIELSNKLIQDNYLDLAHESFQIVSTDKSLDYTRNQTEDMLIRRKLTSEADTNRQKDFDELIELFKNHRGWWD